MNGCNLRGFLLVSNGIMSTIKKSIYNFKKEENGYIFYFPHHFDTFQNITISCNEKVDIFLKNNDEEYYLGTNEYTIFPNSSIPPSFPFFAYRKLNSYLYIPNQNQMNITISFESSILSKEYKEELQIIDYFPYHSIFHLENNKIYSYEKNEVHQPIKNSIKYN